MYTFDKKAVYTGTEQKPELGDTIQLEKLTLPVVQCEETGVLMLNIDTHEIARGDLTFIKKLGLTISNPDTDKPVALGVDYIKDSFGDKLSRFFSPTIIDDDNDDDDSSFFSSGGSFGGGFSGGFGGFGGGSFGGGGFSSSF